MTQRARPEHTSDYLVNPHKGAATFQRFNGDPLYSTPSWNDAEGPMEFPPPANADLHNDRYPPTSVAYCRWAWPLLEPQKGQFNFELIDRALETAAKRKQTLQLRSEPMAGHLSVPQWLWDMGLKRNPKRTFEPDHNDPLYLEHWGEHIRVLGQRYDGHPNLESFDIAYGGGCGETGGNADCLTSRKLVQIYLENFQNTQLVAMVGTSGGTYALEQKDRRIGWRFDCFGDATPGQRYNNFVEWLPGGVHESSGWETWKTGPITMETCWTVPYWYDKGWDIEEIIEIGYKYHPTIFMPKSVYIPEKWMDKMMDFCQRIGYWFHMHQIVMPWQAKRGEKSLFQVTIDNRGVAPIYRPYTFALRFSQGSSNHIVKFRQDIRNWMPDLSYFQENLTIPAALQKGQAKVECAIIDSKDRPSVRMAIKAVTEDGWHPLCSMDILE